MSLFITSLNSGSNGNCYYIANAREAVLVDIGISCREMEKRMVRLGLSLNKVKAIFVSHEHSDHIRGVEVTSRKYNLPVYITALTLNNSPLKIDKTLIRSFKKYEKISIGELTVLAFPKFHDAREPHSFIVQGNGVKIGVFTDIGSTCKHVIKNFKQCHAAFLEANYDEQMLEQGRYPYFLKERIRSNEGHLSNEQALELFISHKPKFMTHLLLSHLSKDNNCPDLVKDLFVKHAKKTTITIASRNKETDLYQIFNSNSGNSTAESGAQQMSLF